MRGYECHICGGICDPGELENGVCFDCRSNDVKRIEQHRLDVRKSINLMLQDRIRQQNDGQMAMRI